MTSPGAAQPSPPGGGEVTPGASGALVAGFLKRVEEDGRLPALPRPIVDRLAAEIEKAMASPEMRERLAATGLEPGFRGTDAFAAHLREQRAVFARIVQQANIKLE
jgi:hypothetical protein